MKKYLFTSLLFIVLAGQNADAGKTRLVVGIVVDQMRADYLSKYYDKFGKDGFRKLLAGGFSCNNTHYNYVPTYTGPGHASIFTGTTPRYHGIIANNWFRKSDSRMVYCTEDKKVKTLGSSSAAGLMSPVNMLTTTISDELHLHTQMRSKVIGISIKDRGAILPAGHSADAAYWYDGSNGAFISSSYYMEKLPAWVDTFNSKSHAAIYLEKTWTTLLPVAAYTESTVDQTAYEGLFNGETAPVFPHKLPSLMMGNGKLNLIKSTPFGNSLLKDFALELLKEEQMGKDSICDFLSISFSSPDYVGHMYGTDAIETEDTYLRLDRDMAEIISALDKNVGRDNYLLFLTADHGAVQNPALLRDRKIPSGYIDEKKIADTLTRHFLAVYKDSLLLSFSNEQIFLDHHAIEKSGHKLKEVAAETARFLLTLNGISNAYTSFDMNNGEFSDDLIFGALFKGFNQNRSGDILISYAPGYTAWEKTGTTHGSAWTYDTHVPLLWYGSGIPHGKTSQYTDITQIAATACALLNIPYPGGCKPHPIPQLVP